MEYSQVKKELKEVKDFYANADVFKSFPEKVYLVDKYKSAVCGAESHLIAFFVYYYIQNNNLQTVAENMQLSYKSIERLSRDLKEFFMKNL